MLDERALASCMSAELPLAKAASSKHAHAINLLRKIWIAAIARKSSMHGWCFQVLSLLLLQGTAWRRQTGLQISSKHSALLLHASWQAWQWQAARAASVAAFIRHSR